ncbi:hypothetical protein A6R68_23678, partial [Neotoma lepida]
MEKLAGMLGALLLKSVAPRQKGLIDTFPNALLSTLGPVFLHVNHLSRNRFTEIPSDVWLFAPLETLNLYHNCIKTIPEAIKNLQIRNLLSTLPKYLFDLPLKVLVVSNNKLVSIPEEIGKLKDLMELDISCNEIQILPQQMGKLHSLKELNIRRNNLHVLPDDFYPNKNHGPDSGIGSDNGEKRLSTTEPSDDDTISLHSQVSESNREQTSRNDSHILGSKPDSQKDQEVYDFIDPNTEDVAVPEQGDTHIGSFVSFLKGKEKCSEKSQKNEELGNEKKLDKEQLLPEEDDDLKEVTDLRKIAAQLLKQEQKNRTSFSDKLFQRTRAAGRKSRILNHSTSVMRNKLKQTVECEKSVSADEGNSPLSPLAWQPLENQKDQIVEQQWPESQPIIWQNEERRRSKQIRKEYFKEYDRTDGFSHGPFGLKPRSAFSRASRQEYGAADPGFTMRRKMEHLREEREQIRQLRNPKLSMAKCRRNVENFLDACKKLGVSQERLCLPHHILEERDSVENEGKREKSWKESQKGEARGISLKITVQEEEANGKELK